MLRRGQRAHRQIGARQVKIHNVKAVLLDSGQVLNTTATGNWFVSPRYFDTVDRAKYDALDPNRRRAAHRTALAYLDAQTRIVTLEEELTHFQRYYELFFEALPELGVSREQAHEVAADLVYNTDKYRFYDDAYRMLNALRGRCRLAVVSNAWPSLREGYKAFGLYDRFDAFVISSELGTTKPDPAMYRTALRQLDVSPEEAVFVDDVSVNCESASAIGLHALMLCRSPWKYRAYRWRNLFRPYGTIPNLDVLNDIM